MIKNMKKIKVNEAVEMVGGSSNISSIKPGEFTPEAQAVTSVAYANEVDRVRAWRDRFFKAMEDKKKYAEKIFEMDHRFAHMNEKDRDFNESIKHNKERITLDESLFPKAIKSIVFEVYEDETIPYLYDEEDQAASHIKRLKDKYLKPEQWPEDEDLIGWVEYTYIPGEGWNIEDIIGKKDHYDEIEKAQTEYFQDVLAEDLEADKENSESEEDGESEDEDEDEEDKDEEQPEVRDAINDFLNDLAENDFDNFEQLCFDLLNSMTDEQIAEFRKDYEYEHPSSEDSEPEDEKEVEIKDESEDEEKDILTEDVSLLNYKPWSGAVDTWDRINEEDKMDEFINLLDELYPDGLDAQALNEFLWFDSDFIYQMLDIED